MLYFDYLNMSAPFKFNSKFYLFSIFFSLQLITIEVHHSCEILFPSSHLNEILSRSCVNASPLVGFLQRRNTPWASMPMVMPIHTRSTWTLGHVLSGDTCYPTHDRHNHHYNPNNCSCGKHGFQQFQMGQSTDSIREHLYC